VRDHQNDVTPTLQFTRRSLLERHRTQVVLGLSSGVVVCSRKNPLHPLSHLE
jgi:hypothetical protein